MFGNAAFGKYAPVAFGIHFAFQVCYFKATYDLSGTAADGVTVRTKRIHIEGAAQIQDFIFGHCVAGITKRRFKFFKPCAIQDLFAVAYQNIGGDVFYPGDVSDVPCDGRIFGAARRGLKCATV